MDRIAYKIISKQIWRSQLESMKKFIGTDLDIKDGFIHLSAKAQLKETARKYFSGQDGLLLISVDLSKVNGEVKWEPSRNNELFPHIYGWFDASAVNWIKDLELTSDKSDFIYPPEVFDS